MLGAVSGRRPDGPRRDRTPRDVAAADCETELQYDRTWRISNARYVRSHRRDASQDCSAAPAKLIMSEASKNDDRERSSMRTQIIMLFVIAAALLGGTQVSSAQSAYSYPWCSLGGPKDTNALSCYFTSWEQCRATMFGLGGICVESPYYHG